MIFHFGKNEPIRLCRVVDKNGNYLLAYRTTENPKEATLYEGKIAKIICEDMNTYEEKWKMEPVFVTITVTEKKINEKSKKAIKIWDNKR